MGRTSKKDIQQENEDPQGVLRRATPKKDIHEELEDRKGEIRRPTL
jgi:hypothetical protein